VDVKRRVEKIAMQFRRRRFVVNVRRFGEMKITYKIFVNKSEGSI
jgi:hypothetical protein